jgi:splicing factor 3A subunit 2
MSAFEQRVETPDKKWQYLLFACDPYESVGFKIPNVEIDKGEGRFFSQWDPTTKKFTLQLYFREKDKNDPSHRDGPMQHQAPPPPPQRPPPPPQMGMPPPPMQYHQQHGPPGGYPPRPMY